MAKTNTETLGDPVPVRFQPEVRRNIKRTAKKIGLSELATIRKATEMGLPVLLQALCSPAKAA